MVAEKIPDGWDAPEGAPACAGWTGLAEESLPRFLFVRYARDGEDDTTGLFPVSESVTCKLAVCSACGGVTIWEKGSDRYRMRAGDCAICGQCGEHGRIVRADWIKNGASLEGTVRLVFPQVLGRDRVILRGYEVNYNFLDAARRVAWGDTHEIDVTPELTWHEVARYDLSPGRVTVDRIGEEWTPIGNEWREEWFPRGIIEPWSSDMGGMQRQYTIFTGLLKGSFLGWLTQELIEGVNGAGCRDTCHYGYVGITTVPWCKIIARSAERPGIEHLMRRGIWEPVIELVAENRENARYVDWGARSGVKFLRVPEADAVAFLRDKRFDFGALKLCRDFGLGHDEAALWREADYAAEDIRGVFADCRDLIGRGGAWIRGVAAAGRYLARQRLAGRDAWILLRDYWQDCRALGRDITAARVRFPRDLRQAHDDAAASRTVMSLEDKSRVYRDTVYPDYRRRFEWHAGEFCAIVPERLYDIALEGKNQRHCVAGYVDRHAHRKCAIVFIRRRLAPMVPVWTVELSPEGELIQIQGYNNKSENKPRGTGQVWVDAWLLEIKKRIKKERANG